MAYSERQLKFLRSKGLFPIRPEYFGEPKKIFESFTCDELADIMRVSKNSHDAKKHKIPVVFDDLAKRLPYRTSVWKLYDTNDEPVRLKIPLHIGQRKLLLSEVQFLSQLIDGKPLCDVVDCVVYAGAAPSIHTPLLCELFPGLEFFLYDPARFAIRDTKKIHVFRSLFTDGIAESFRNKKVAFISDIRSGDSVKKIQEFEEAVSTDMGMQRKWVEIMQPVASLLKFRLPYTEDGEAEKVDYFDGIAFLQVWSPRSSTELRLFVTDPDSKKTYDPAEYEEKLFYQNIISRGWEFFPHNFPLGLVKGLDYCFDCNLELHIWNEFLENCCPEVDKDYYVDATAELMNRSSRVISKGLDLFHHGMFPDTPMIEKVQKILPELQMYLISKRRD